MLQSNVIFTISLLKKTIWNHKNILWVSSQQNVETKFGCGFFTLYSCIYWNFFLIHLENMYYYWQSIESLSSQKLTHQYQLFIHRRTVFFIALGIIHNTHNRMKFEAFFYRILLWITWLNIGKCCRFWKCVVRFDLNVFQKKITTAKKLWTYFE